MAHWTLNQFTVTFDVDGATTTAPVQHGDTAERPDDPAKTGFIFIGWYKGDAEFDFTVPVTASVTLTACWQEADAPMITGLVAGKTYCGPVTFSVNANSLTRTIDNVSVTVNGKTLTPDVHGTYTLQPASGPQKVIAANQVGKTAAMTVTVNDGHTWGKWASNGDGSHTHICSISGCAETEKTSCTGGEATCTEKPLCDQCGSPYAAPNPNAHPSLVHVSATASTAAEPGNIEHWHCEHCNKYYADAAATREISQEDTVVPSQPEVPKTGDAAPLPLWFGLMFLTLAGIALIQRRIRN